MQWSNRFDKWVPDTPWFLRTPLKCFTSTCRRRNIHSKLKGGTLHQSALMFLGTLYLVADKGEKVKIICRLCIQHLFIMIYYREIKCYTNLLKSLAGLTGYRQLLDGPPKICKYTVQAADLVCWKKEEVFRPRASNFGMKHWIWTCGN